MEEYFNVLAACPLFDSIGDENLRALLKCLRVTRRVYEKNAYVFSAGDAAPQIGVVLSGRVHVLHEDYWGNRTILAAIATGNLFGEAFSCAETDNVTVSVLAAERTEVLYVDYARIATQCSASCDFHATLIKNLLRLLARKNIQLTQKLEIVTSRTTRERLMAYLSAQAQAAGSNRFTIPFNRQQLADFLSVERSAMSAELGRMQADGLLQTRRSEFELSDVSSLAKYP